MIKLRKKMVVKGIVFLATSLILTTVFTSFAPTQQEAIIFLGQPTHKVSEGGIERTPEKLSKEKASQFLCVIVKKGDKYYWKSRENKELVKMDSGAFTYFIAPTSGYVKFIKRAVRIGQKWGGIDPKGNHLIRKDFYKRQQKNDTFLLQAFNNQPSNSTNFIQAIYIHGRHKNTNAVIRSIDTFARFAGDDPKKLTLIKNSYGLIGRWKDKEEIDQRLTEIEPDRYETWFDLAQTRIQLGKTNQAVDDLRTALQKHRDSESNSTYIRTAMMTNNLFRPFREHPDIKPFLKKDP